jgi:hypothetical protein
MLESRAGRPVTTHLLLNSKNRDNYTPDLLFCNRDQTKFTLRGLYLLWLTVFDFDGATSEDFLLEISLLLNLAFRDRMGADSIRFIAIYSQ